MKILIQDRQSRLFFKQPREWTENPDDATCFAGALAAFTFSGLHDLGDTEIVFVKERGQQSVRMRSLVETHRA